MRRRILGLLLVIFCLTGCVSINACSAAQKRTMYFFDTFDTLITIFGYTEDQETFDRITAQAQADFLRLHQLFDAYHEYEGIQNIYTLNRDTPSTPVSIAPELAGLLAFAKEWQPKLLGTVNIAMGGVFKLWHDYRQQGTASPELATLPPMDALRAAAAHGDLDSVVLNTETNTVYFTDPNVRLDVGAVAKGYAAELVAQMLLQTEMPHFIVNAGGNVRMGHPPLDGRTSWGVSIQNPDAALGLPVEDASAEVLYLSNRSVVTSGDYERFYMVNGVRYHHIISPTTLMPATENRSITIVCEDSGLADMLSTAMFILPYAEGLQLAESLEGVDVLWITQDGEILMTDALRSVSKSGGAQP